MGSGGDCVVCPANSGSSSGTDTTCTCDTGYYNSSMSGSVVTACTAYGCNNPCDACVAQASRTSDAHCEACVVPNKYLSGTTCLTCPANS